MAIEARVEPAIHGCCASRWLLACVAVLHADRKVLGVPRRPQRYERQAAFGRDLVCKLTVQAHEPREDRLSDAIAEFALSREARRELDRDRELPIALLV